MTRHLLLICSLSFILHSAHAAPYVSGSIGGHQNDSECDPGFFSSAGVPDLIRCEKDSKAATVRAGYRWPTGPGVEVSYLYTGDTKSHMYDDAERFRVDITFGAGIYVEQLQQQRNRTIALSATYSWEFVDSFHVVAKLGVAQSNGRSTTAIVTNGPAPATINTWGALERTRTRPYLGAEIQYLLTSSDFVSVSFDTFALGYDKVWPGTRDPNTEAVKAKMISIGFGKYF